jgi:hypothetical protein
MVILLACLALDHEATEKHCLKAANGCLSCACSQDDFADATGRAFSPMMVEDVIRRIEEASAEYLDRDGNTLDGKIGAVARWEHEHKIKLHWNNWFDVSHLPPRRRQLFAILFPESDCSGAIVQLRVLDERFQLYTSINWCFMHAATIGLFGNHIVKAVVNKIKATLRNDLYTKGSFEDGRIKYFFSEAALDDVFTRLLTRLTQFESTSAGFQITAKYVSARFASSSSKVTVRSLARPRVIAYKLSSYSLLPLPLGTAESAWPPSKCCLCKERRPCGMV